MTKPTMSSQELLEELRAHAHRHGWNLVEWDWKDEMDGIEGYTVWLSPLTEES